MKAQEEAGQHGKDNAGNAPPDDSPSPSVPSVQATKLEVKTEADEEAMDPPQEG